MNKDHPNIKDILERPEEEIQIKFNLNDVEKTYDSPSFQQRKDTFRALLNMHSADEASNDISKAREKDESSITKKTFDSHVIFLNNWKNIENVSARLIEIHDDTVILECLVDKENWIYEEREFRLALFKEFNLEVGNLFYLRVFDRASESKIEIHDDPKLTSINDFPKMDFNQVFKDFILFKK